MITKLTVLTLVLIVSLVPQVGAQTDESFPHGTVGDFGPQRLHSTVIIDDGPVARDHREAPTDSRNSKIPNSPLTVKLVVKARNSKSTASSSAKNKKAFSPKLSKLLTDDTQVGDFEHSDKNRGSKVFGKPMMQTPMTARPMSMSQVPSGSSKRSPSNSAPAQGPATVRGWKF